MIFSILTEYAKTHSVLINTHNFRIIMKTDYLYVLKNGIIVQEGRPKQLIKNAGLFRSVFDGDKLHIQKKNKHDAKRLSLDRSGIK
jgi:ABC-type transport system involved in cytochrome bd biosynthesis fused ATPase/permease subunit